MYERNLQATWRMIGGKHRYNPLKFKKVTLLQRDRDVAAPADPHVTSAMCVCVCVCVCVGGGGRGGGSLGGLGITSKSNGVNRRWNFH